MIRITEAEFYFITWMYESKGIEACEWTCLSDYKRELLYREWLLLDKD